MKKVMTFIIISFLFLWIFTYIIGLLGGQHLGAKSSYSPYEFCEGTQVTQFKYYLYISCVGDNQPYVYPLIRAFIQTGVIALIFTLCGIIAILPLILLRLMKKHKQGVISQYIVFTITAAAEFYIVYRVLLFWVSK